MHPILPNGPCPVPRPRALLVLAVLGLTAASLAVGVLGVQAAPGGDVLDARRGRVRALEAEVQSIDAQAVAAADAHAAAVGRAQELRARIAETTAALADAHADYGAAIERLSERLVALYREEPPTLAEIILTSGSLTEAVDAQRALAAVGEGDARIVAQLRATRARLGTLRAELISGRHEVEESVAASRARLAELEGLIGERRRALAGARGTLDGLVRARRRSRAAAAAEARAEALLLRRAQPGSATPAARAVAVAPAAPAGPAPTGDVAAALERIALCESGGNPRAVSASGQYRGKYQFDQGAWEGLGGVGDPAAAPEAEQDRIAALLYARSGPAPWPVCGYR
jgi:peptidoglycan hydrolase CwlO-like protein